MQFEELQVMKFLWCKNVDDLVELNSEEVEEVILDTYHEILTSDHWEDEFDKGRMRLFQIINMDRIDQSVSYLTCNLTLNHLSVMFKRQKIGLQSGTGVIRTSVSLTQIQFKI